MRKQKREVFVFFRNVAIIAALFFFGTPPALFAADNSDDYLHVSGNQIRDVKDTPVRLTGIAWFGFETPEQVYHGLWQVNMEATLDQVADLGFNLLRIPLSVQLVNQWRNGEGGTAQSINQSANPDLAGMASLQILDRSIAYCKQIGLKVMLDMHRVVNTQMRNTWYANDFPPADFEACWQWLARHYAGDDTVIAMDIFNEPHGQPGESDMAKWDDSANTNNWKHTAETVAKKVLDINPNLLIVIEGIEVTPKDGFTYAEVDQSNYNYNWWGGNLRRVRDYPIDLGARQSQLVYSPHDYGPSVYNQPWFESGFTQSSLMTDCWRPNWLYIAEENIAPILIGEWGGKMDGGENQKWMTYLTDTIVQYDLNHTFWCVNPNSGDTGGILKDDWQTVDTTKYNLIKKALWMDSSGKAIGLDHQVNIGKSGTHVGATATESDDATISPAAANFDINDSESSGITVTMTLQDHTLTAVKNGSETLVNGSDYTVSGQNLTIEAHYLAQQPVGATRLIFEFDSGRDAVLTVTISDSSTDSDTALSEKCSGECNAATPVNPTISDNGGVGNVTMYTTEASSGGACNYGATNVMYYAAMNADVAPGDGMGQWQGGAICGQCAEVTVLTSGGPKKVVVRIMNKCPDPNCGIDLGGATPGAIMIDGSGRYDGSWRFVSCEGHPEVFDGSPALKVLAGSNQWWSRVHVENGFMAVDTIKWQADNGHSGVFPFATNPENTWEVPEEVLQSSAASIGVTIHYVDGATATVTVTPHELSTAEASYRLEPN